MRQRVGVAFLMLSLVGCAVESTFKGRMFGKSYEPRENGDVGLTVAISLLRAGVADALIVDVLIGQGHTDAEARRIFAQAQAQLSCASADCK